LCGRTKSLVYFPQALFLQCRPFGNRYFYFSEKFFGRGMRYWMAQGDRSPPDKTEVETDGDANPPPITMILLFI